MTVAEVAELLDLSPSGVRRAADEGRLPCVRDGAGARVFEPEAVRRFAAARGLDVELHVGPVPAAAAAGAFLRVVDEIAPDVEGSSELDVEAPTDQDREARASTPPPPRSRELLALDEELARERAATRAQLDHLATLREADRLRRAIAEQRRLRRAAIVEAAVAGEVARAPVWAARHVRQAVEDSLDEATDEQLACSLTVRGRARAAAASATSMAWEAAAEERRAALLGALLQAVEDQLVDQGWPAATARVALAETLAELRQLDDDALRAYGLTLAREVAVATVTSHSE